MTGKQKLSVALLLAFVVLVASSCWKQQDVITIDTDGNMTCLTLATVVDSEVDFKNVEESTNNLLQILAEAGWRGQKKWISKEKPYRLQVMASCNLRTAGSVEDEFTITRISENKIGIRFETPDTKNPQTFRNIVVRSLPHGNNVPLLDPSGKPVYRIDNVDSKVQYTVILPAR